MSVLESVRRFSPWNPLSPSLPMKIVACLSLPVLCRLSRTNNADGTETIVIRASAPLAPGVHRFLRFALIYTR